MRTSARFGTGSAIRRSLLAGLPLLLFLLTTPAAIRAEETSLSTPTRQVLLPLVTVETVSEGQVESDPSRGSFAVDLVVDPPVPSRGWVLTIRADRPVFDPEAAGKPCTDLWWKHDHENASKYRRLDEHEQIVLENPAGGTERIELDLSVSIGWKTEPGSYGLGILFRVLPL